MFGELPASSAFGSSYIPQNEPSYQLMFSSRGVKHARDPHQHSQKILLMSLIGSLARTPICSSSQTGGNEATAFGHGCDDDVDIHRQLLSQLLLLTADIILESQCRQPIRVFHFMCHGQCIDSMAVLTLIYVVHEESSSRIISSFTLTPRVAVYNIFATAASRLGPLKSYSLVHQSIQTTVKTSMVPRNSKQIYRQPSYVFHCFIHTGSLAHGSDRSCPSHRNGPNGARSKTTRRPPKKKKNSNRFPPSFKNLLNDIPNTTIRRRQSPRKIC